jgi:phage-related protein
MEGEDEVSAIANFLSESGQLVSFEFSSPGECQTVRIPCSKPKNSRNSSGLFPAMLGC